MGKAGHIRTVPIPAWVKTAMDGWMKASGITEGVIFRPINKKGRVWGNGMTAKVLWEVVRELSGFSLAMMKKIAHQILRCLGKPVDFFFRYPYVLQLKLAMLRLH